MSIVQTLLILCRVIPLLFNSWQVKVCCPQTRVRQDRVWSHLVKGHHGQVFRVHLLIVCSGIARNGEGDYTGTMCPAKFLLPCPFPGTHPLEFVVEMTRSGVRGCCWSRRLQEAPSVAERRMKVLIKPINREQFS